jgi:hypothetical protein
LPDNHGRYSEDRSQTWEETCLPEAVEDNMLDGPDEGEHLAASSHFEIMANVIWAEIGQALMEELGAVIFSAGRAYRV